MKTHAPTQTQPAGELAAALQEIAILRLQERKVRATLRELAERLPSEQKTLYARLMIRAGLSGWLSVR